MQPVTGLADFVGSNVTPEVKTALRAEAQKAGMSVSRYVYLKLHEMMEKAGYKLGPPVYKYNLTTGRTNR